MVVIQGKLDGIKTRYAEINTMSNNVTKTLEQALSLASKLEHTHEDLASWLDKVEADLEVFGTQEPVGEQLTQVQESRKVSLPFPSAVYLTTTQLSHGLKLTHRVSVTSIAGCETKGNHSCASHPVA